MSFNVIGTKPANKSGESFDINNWGWRPIANYIIETFPTHAARVQYWQSNDGDGLNGRNALQLGEAFRLELTSGRCAAFIAKYEADRKALPLKKCWLCEGSGVRPWPEQESKLLTPGQQKKYGRTHGWCNGCDGSGKQPQDAYHYPMNIKWMEEFCTFLENCGGFEIW